MPKLPSLSDDAVLGDLFRAFPGHAPYLMPFVDIVMRGPGEWEIAEREFIAAYVSALNACTYCLGAHVIYAEAFGLPAARLEAALEDPDAAGLSEKLAATLKYVRLFNALPHKGKQADMAAVLAAGVSEKAIYEALMIAATFNMMNRVAEGTGVTFDLRRDPTRHGLSALQGDERGHRYAPPS